MEFTIRIDDAAFEGDGRFSGIDARVRGRLVAEDATVRDAVAQFAVEEMLAWLAGRTAYQSVTQQQTEWVERLLPKLFPDRPPTAAQLYSTFSIPYGRAAYIARVIAESQNSHWRTKGREALEATLAARVDEIGDDPTVEIVVHLDTFSARELTVVVDEVFAGDLPPGVAVAPPTVRETSPGRFEARMQAWFVTAALALLGELR